MAGRGAGSSTVRSLWASLAYGLVTAVVFFAVGCMAIGAVWADGLWLEASATTAVVAGLVMGRRVRLVLAHDGVFVVNPLRTLIVERGDRVLVEQATGASLAGGGRSVPCLRLLRPGSGSVAVVASVRLKQADLDELEQRTRAGLLRLGALVS